MKSVVPTPGFVENQATFDGPFKSWINIKSTFGAKGDGVSDDTSALQNALNSQLLNQSVLWLPRGTYKITSPLYLSSATDFSVIGEDPANTSIVWSGPVGGSMLTFDGCSGFKFSRITLDGSGSAGTALAVIWTHLPGQYYPTRDLISDSRIVNVAIGIQVGYAGETTVDRIHFDHNSQAGISLGDWDALNFNVLDSLFTDCGYGVTNNFGQGAFNVYNSVFVRSTTSDVGFGNTGPFSFRGNISLDSARFLWELGNGAPANTVIEGNTIVGTAFDPITIRDPGPVMLIDNQFLQLDSALHLVNAEENNPLGLFSAGNIFTVSVPYAGNIGRLTSLDESAYSSDMETPPNIPLETYVPPQSGRPIYEVPQGSSSGDIQALINTAVAGGSGVIHFPAGYYSIDTTLHVTSSADIAIIGDGDITQLAGSGQLVGSVIYSDGTRLQINDIGLSSSPSVSAAATVQLTLPDVPSTHVFCDECATYSPAISGFSVDGMDQAAIEVRVAELNTSFGTSRGVTVHGGNARQAGSDSLGRVTLFMVSTDSYGIDSGGELLITDGWHDGGQGPIQFVATGSGSITQQGGTIYTNATSPGMTADNFSGNISILGVSTNSTLSIDGGTTPNVFVASSIQVTGQDPVNSGQQTANVSEIESYYYASNGTPGTVPDSVLKPGTLEQMLAMSRTQYLLPRNPSITNAAIARLTRVFVAPSQIAFQISPSVSNSSSPSYSISPVPASASTQACGVAGVSLAGNWKLADGGDGFVGLENMGGYLSEVPSGSSGNSQVVAASAMSSSLDRWIVQDNGDGSVAVVNRATGDLLTCNANGCASASPRSNASNQQWLIDLTQ